MRIVMVLLFALTGLLTGWLVNLASDYLPLHGEGSRIYWPATVSPLFGKRSSVPSFWLDLSIEVLTLLIFAWFGLRFGLSGTGLLLAAGYVLFLLIAVIDWKYRLILNSVTYPAIIAVLAVHSLILHNDLRAILVGGLLAFGVFYLVFQLRPGQLGGGDVKLAGLIGLTFGFPQVLGALLVGAGVGGAAAVYLLLRRAGKHYRIPYAPFLCFGAIVILLYYSL
jgi:prepilin signal peptidase PulO-like enzyme (type II secretory pathway)